MSKPKSKLEDLFPKLRALDSFYGVGLNNLVIVYVKKDTKKVRAEVEKIMKEHAPDRRYTVVKHGDPRPAGA